MPTETKEFGIFVSRGPYMVGATASVDLAVAKDAKQERFALKRFHPPASGRITRVLELEAWRLSMERQQGAAREGSAAVEVVAYGSYDEGEYAVFPWKRRTLLSIITTVSPTGNRLRALTAGLLAALKSWEQHYGSPHGRLKATNVFVEGEGPLQSLRFFLSDPSWQLRIPAERLRTQELAQLGALIVQMVRGREAGGAPIEDAPEWQRLGRAGPAWRNFSNFLLDASSSPSARTLEAAESHLKTIPVDFRPGRLVGRRAAGLSFLVCCGAVGYARLGDPRTMSSGLLWIAEKIGNPRAVREQAIPEWVLLCRAWNDWVADLVTQSSGFERTRELWAPSDTLRVALAEFRQRSEALQPQALLPAEDSEGRSLYSLAQTPPASVKRERVVRRILESWSAVSLLSGELEHWLRWEEFRSLHESLASVGKNEAASVVAPFAPSGLTATGKFNPRVALDGIASLARNTAALALASEWKAWKTRSDELRNSGDRVQSAMPRLALQELPNTGNLGELAASLASSLSQLRRRREMFLNPAVARERFLKESPLLSEQGAVSPADLERWERELSMFSRLPADEDPRTAVRWEARLAALQSSALDLEEEVPEAEASSDARLLKRADFLKNVGQLRTQILALQRREDLRRGLPELLLETSHAQTDLHALEQRLEATLLSLRPDRWLAEVAAMTWTYEAAQRRWDEWRRGRVAGIAASSLEKDRSKLRLLRKEERTLKDWLSSIDGPNGLGADAATIDAAVGIKTAVEKLNRAFREHAAAAVLSVGEWDGMLPRDSFGDTIVHQPAARLAITDYRQWSAGLPKFAADLEELSRALAEGLSWSEGLATLWARVSQRPGVDTLDGQPRALLKTAGRLRDLSTTQDLGSLTAAITAGDLPGELTAWLRLGELPEWPASTAQLDQEIHFATILRTDIGKLPGGARRDGLSARLVDGQRERWLRLARSAVRKSAPIDEVFARAQKMGIEPEKLASVMAYNLKLWELKQLGKNAVELSKLKTARDEFVSMAKELTALAGNPTVASFLKDLVAVPLKDDLSGSRERTPRNAGWREELSDDGRQLSASWSAGPRKILLEYQLIEPSDGTPAFFLARRTLAVGEFLDLMAARPEADVMLKAMPAWVWGSPTAPGDVLSAWVPRNDRHGLEPSITWLPNPSSTLKGKLDDHPAQLDKAIEERPGPRSPLQFVPPEFARLFVEQVLGARLPTPTEWRSLTSGLASTVEGTFRSKPFEALWQYIARDGAALTWQPTTGAFFPSNSPTESTRSLKDDGAPWPGSKTTALWPIPVDDGPVTSGIINLFGNVWVYLLDENRKEFFVAGGSILTPPSVDVRSPQRIPLLNIIGRRAATFGDGFTDVGLRPAFNASASLRQRLQFFRLVSSQSFITE